MIVDNSDEEDYIQPMTAEEKALIDANYANANYDNIEELDDYDYSHFEYLNKPIEKRNDDEFTPRHKN